MEDIAKDIDEFGTTNHSHMGTDSYGLPVNKFVDRGDSGGYDFRTADLTIDGAWHDLDLSEIIRKEAKAVCITGYWRGWANQYIFFRRNGSTDDDYNPGLRTQVDSIGIQGTIIVPVYNQAIQYKTNIYNIIDMKVIGWWE